MNVIVYTTSSCPFCNMLMSHLSEKNISYIEKKVDQDSKAAEEMALTSGGFLGVPFTVVEKDGNRETVIGFDKNRIDLLLG